ASGTAAGLALPSILGGPSMAQSSAWPSSAIRVVVPFEAGTGTDIIGRTARGPLDSALQQPAIIDNRPGASGSVAMGIVARSKPDGYTIGICSPSNMTINHHRMEMPYDPRTDFTPLSLFAILPNVISVHPDVPAHTFEELLE